MILSPLRGIIQSISEGEKGMNTQMPTEIQYRNIVRKFFFRQNPPKPLTKEDFIKKNGLENISTKECEKRYYSYLYYYNYEYVKALDEKVEREIREGAKEDPYLAEIEKELEKGKKSNQYTPESVFKQEIDTQKKPRKPKKKLFNFRKRIKPIKKKPEKQKIKESKESTGNEKPEVSKKNTMKLVIAGIFSILFVSSGIYGLFHTMPSLIISGFDFASYKIPLLASSINTLLGIIGIQVISYMKEKEEEEIEEEIGESEEEEFATVNELKNKLAKAKEKDKAQEPANISNVQLTRETDSRKPQFVSNQEPNHQRIQIADSKLNQSTENISNDLPRPVFLQQLEKEEDPQNWKKEKTIKLKLER